MATATIAAIIAGAFGLAVAIVAARANLLTKKLDLIGQSEQRRADALNRGYDSVLAAYDLFWHYRCHVKLSDLGHDPEFDFKKDWHPFRSKVELTFSAGIDLLHENSLHFSRLAPALIWMTKIAFDGVNLRKLEAMPEDYEEARVTFKDFRRIDTRIDKPVGRRFWKKLGKDHKAKEFSELTSDETLRRINAMIEANPNATFVWQAGPGDDPEDNPILSYLKQFEARPPVLVASLQITSGRISDWKKSGVIDYKGPCQKLKKPCYEVLRAKLAAEASDD